MSSFNLLEGSQLNYLYPLNKWRFLSLEDLFEEGQYPGTISGFRKYILRLEKKEVINSFRSGKFGRKYVYLTKKGGMQVGLDNATLNLSTETLLHDVRVSDITRAFLDFNTISKIELEHEIILDRGKNQYTPDALIYGKRKKINFKMAFELELTRKATDKYLDKMEHYLRSNFYDYALYFFQHKGIFDSYKKYLEREKGVSAFDKILFALNTDINKRRPQLDESYVFFMGKEVTLKDVFNR